MDAVARRLPPGDAAALAIKAGNDVVLHSPDDDGGGGGDQGGGGEGRHSAGADRRVGPAHPPREGAARAAQGQGRVARRPAEGRRRPRARRGGAGGQQEVDHAGQGRSQSGAAAQCRAKRRCCTCRSSTTTRAGGSRRRAARCCPSIRAAMAGHDRDRAVGSLDDVGDRSRPRLGATLRRDRRVGVRPGVVRQRPDGSGAAARPAARAISHGDREHAEAVHHGVLRQSVRARWRSPACRPCC